MSKVQKDILVIGAIAFLLTIWTAPRVQYTQGSVLKANTNEGLENSIDLRTALGRGIGILGTMYIFWLAAKGCEQAFYHKWKPIQRYLGVAAIAILLLGYGFMPNVVNMIQIHKVTSAIKKGEVVIDQVKPEWKYDGNSLNLSLYIRNGSHHIIHGRMIFECRLSGKGFDPAYLDFVINTKGATTIETLGQKKNLSGLAKATYEYYQRGQVVQPGMTYEPTSEPSEDYIFAFREPISLGIGEISEITHFQNLSNVKLGGFLTVTIRGIELTPDNG